MIWRIVTTLSVLAAVSAKAEVLTLDQAVALAVEHNRTLRNTALDVKKAEDRVKATRSRQYPGFNLYALGSQQLQAYDFTLEKGILGTYPGTGPLPDHDVHLKSPLAPTGLMMAKVTQPLTSLIRLRRNIDSLKTSAELSSEQLREDRLK